MYSTIAPTLSQRAFPRVHPLVRDAVLIILGAALVAALAQVRLPLPFTPVPLTGQTFGVLLIGAALGARRGAASLLVYLGAGLAGLPVFTQAGSGWGHLAGPTGGYLVGFLLAAALVGWLAEKGLERRWRSAVLPALAGQVVIYACGLLWLAQFTGWQNVLAAGLLPFVAGDLIKLALAWALLPTAWRLVGE